ncbi:MAG: cytochrome c [Candidatus Thioglobus sp.]|nr:cytochrome c [Candidatus Thioglobus sp.]
MKKIFLLMAVLVIGFFALFYDGTVFDLKKSKLLPDLNYKPDISQGKSKYQSTCMKCHGKSLLGTETGPSLLDNTYKPSHHADLSFYYAVKSGVRQHHWKFGDMPMITGLSPERVSDIIAYVRQQQKLSW